MTAPEFADFYPAVAGGNMSFEGCWMPSSAIQAMPERRVVASINTDSWNRLAPKTKRIIRTVVLSPNDWFSNEIQAYADMANSSAPAADIDEKVLVRFNFDCGCIPGRPRGSSNAMPPINW